MGNYINGEGYAVKRMKYRRFAAFCAILCAAALLLLAASPAVGHDCDGDGCVICAVLSSSAKVLATLLVCAAVGGIASAAASLCRDIRHHAATPAKTPILLKTKLTD